MEYTLNFAQHLRKVLSSKFLDDEALLYILYLLDEADQICSSSI